jgi:hypothetical protein
MDACASLVCVAERAGHPGRDRAPEHVIAVLDNVGHAGRPPATRAPASECRLGYPGGVRRSVIPIALAAAFGAADQFLGARAWIVGSWAIGASLLSAPWLLVAFAAGWAQPTARRAVTLGFVCTLTALLGYWAMTLSPIEGAVVTLRSVGGLLVGQSTFAIGAVVTGPIFGWLGYRWGTRRDRLSGLAAALVVCFEPLAHALAGPAVSLNGVWETEVMAGLLMAIYAITVSQRHATG